MKFIDYTIRTQLASISNPKGSSTPTQKDKKYKNIILPTSLIGAGAIAGDIFTRKKYPARLEEEHQKLDNIIDEIGNFLESARANNEINRFMPGECSPYDKIEGYFYRMNHIQGPPYFERPNCLLFVSENEKKASDMIDWYASASRQNAKTIDLFDDNLDFVDFLENMEEHFQKTGKWNVVHVKNMDKAINPSEVEPPVIASMKAIMCSTEKDYHTTLLFQTKDVSKLDDIAIESNRVSHFFDVDNMKHFNEFKTLINKYNDQIDLIGKIEKNKKNIICKGVTIGLAVGTIVTGMLLGINKITNNKNKEKVNAN